MKVKMIENDQLLCTEMEQLAQELKETCDERGRELDYAKSASIIHRIGLLHQRKRSQKISLIKSIGLLNAAIVRNPRNVLQIENELSELCKFILKEANAKDQTADLLEQARYIKSLINAMRENSNQMLAQINKKPENLKEKLVKKTTKNPNKATDKQIYLSLKNKIESIQKIQSAITEDYKEIMKKVSLFSETVMGPPPCKFAVAGMGSMARKEITPYSDFEHIILLEVRENFESHLEYFRWFSVVFHVVILNLQETLIPSLHIMHLNDNTSTAGDWFFDTQTKGVSFDGMMPHACKFPLGRQRPTTRKPWTTELIQPVDKMVQYLGSEESLKNGYCLSDILTATCYVHGDQDVYDEFDQRIHKFKSSKTREETLSEIKQQVKEDLDKFSARFSLSKLKINETFNLKQLFYRSSTLFIIALGKIQDTTSTSCFDIIDELAKKDFISQNTKKNLHYAVAIACEIRLRVYAKKKSQHDCIELRQKSEKTFVDLLEVVGTTPTLTYFQITYCLQCEIIRLLDFQKTHIYSNPKLLNVAICYALKRDRLLYSLLIERLPFLDLKFLLNYGDLTFDENLALLKEQTEFFQEKNQHSNIKKIFNVLWNVALQLHDKKQYDGAVEFFKTILDICYREASDSETLSAYELPTCQGKNFVFLLLFISMGLLELDEEEEALRYANQFLEDIKASFHEFDDMSFWCYLAGKIFFILKEYHSSLICLQLSLGISLSLDAKKDVTPMKYSGIATCLMHLQCYEESLSYFKIAIKLWDDVNIIFFGDVVLKAAFTIFSTYRNYGKCFMHLKQYKNALKQFYRAFAEVTASDREEENIEDLLNILLDLSNCFLKLNRIKEHTMYLERLLEIRGNLFL